jgi:hypothetical protein
MLERSSNPNGGTMITSLHIERGRQMRTLLESKIAEGTTAADAIESLAAYLGIQVDSVRLAIAIANDADR